MPYNDTAKIREHYDLASGHYHTLWGEHIHHGYWITGKESKEEAADALIRLLVEKAGIHRGASVLDIGCGVGGSSRWLAKNMDCRVTGVTISPVQVGMAEKETAKLNLSNPPRFRVADANALPDDLDGPFDFLWSVEMISHLQDRDNLFRRASQLLKPGGRMAITDWWKTEGLSVQDEAKYIEPIEKGMLVSLPTFSEYSRHITNHGFRVLWFDDISDRVYRTWDIISDAITNPTVWGFALKHGKELVEFLHSFKAMRAGFKSGAFRYPAMVLEKI
jgi:tocopherol O-methyltransferase